MDGLVHNFVLEERPVVTPQATGLKRQMSPLEELHQARVEARAIETATRVISEAVGELETPYYEFVRNIEYCVGALYERNCDFHTQYDRPKKFKSGDFQRVAEELLKYKFDLLTHDELPEAAQRIYDSAVELLETAQSPFSKTVKEYDPHAAFRVMRDEIRRDPMILVHADVTDIGMLNYIGEKSPPGSDAAYFTNELPSYMLIGELIDPDRIALHRSVIPGLAEKAFSSSRHLSRQDFITNIVMGFSRAYDFKGNFEIVQRTAPSENKALYHTYVPEGAHHAITYVNVDEVSRVEEAAIQFHELTHGLQAVNEFGAPNAPEKTNVRFIVESIPAEEGPTEVETNYSQAFKVFFKNPAIAFDMYRGQRIEREAIFVEYLALSRTYEIMGDVVQAKKYMEGANVIIYQDEHPEAVRPFDFKAQFQKIRIPSLEA